MQKNRRAKSIRWDPLTMNEADKKAPKEGPWSKFANNPYVLCLTDLPSNVTEHVISLHYSRNIKAGKVRSVHLKSPQGALMAVVKFSRRDAAKDAAMRLPPRFGKRKCAVRYLGRSGWHTGYRKVSVLIKKDRERRENKEYYDKLYGRPSAEDIALRQSVEKKDEAIDIETRVANWKSTMENLMRKDKQLQEEISRQSIVKKMERVVKLKSLKCSKTNIEHWRKENNVEVHPRAPPPIRYFREVNFQENVMQMLLRDYKQPTPIQAQAWPVLLGGKDCLGIAGAGTGKTLAYTLPALIHIKQQQEKGSPLSRGGLDAAAPRALILTASTELTKQVAFVVRPFARALKVRASYAFPDEDNYREQAARIIEGTEILVTIPETLMDFLEKKIVTLKKVSFLVLDDANRFLTPEYDKILPKLLGHIRPTRQVAMFCSSWDPEMTPLAMTLLQRPIKVTVGLAADGNTAVACKVEQRMIFAKNAKEKGTKLLRILSHLDEKFPDEHRTIIFANTKATVRDVYGFLLKNGYGQQIKALHGDMLQPDRDEGLQRIKNNPKYILVTTDMGIQGVHVGGLRCIINIQMPSKFSIYLQRIKKTDATGVTFSFIAQHDGPIIPDLIQCIRDAGQTPHERLELIAQLKSTPPAQEEPLVSIEYQLQAMRKELYFEPRVWREPIKVCYSTKAKKGGKSGKGGKGGKGGKDGKDGKGGKGGKDFSFGKKSGRGRRNEWIDFKPEKDEDYEPRGRRIKVPKLVRSVGRVAQLY